MSDVNAQCACDIHSPRINPFADQYAPFFSIVDSSGAFSASGGSLAGEAGHDSSLSSGPGSRSKISQ